MQIEIIIFGAFVALIVGRVIWEKRTGRPEYHDSEAVGGWFGGVPEETTTNRSRRSAS
jgi:hypothetical protein